MKREYDNWIKDINKPLDFKVGARVRMIDPPFYEEHLKGLEGTVERIWVGATTGWTYLDVYLDDPERTETYKKSRFKLIR